MYILTERREKSICTSRHLTGINTLILNQIKVRTPQRRQRDHLNVHIFVNLQQ